MLKGCIATPLARAGGALLQQFRPDLGIAFGYYGGIGAVTVLIGVWQMVELAAFVREALALGRWRRAAGHPRRRPSSLGLTSIAVTRAEVELLLEAAMWAPFHGSRPPWRFVVLGKALMRRCSSSPSSLRPQLADHRLGNGKRGTEEEYRKWRAMTEEEITAAGARSRS